MVAFFRVKFTSQKLAAHVSHRLISQYRLGRWSVVPTLVGVKNIEYIVWENCRVFNVELGGRHSNHCA